MRSDATCLAWNLILARLIVVIVAQRRVVPSAAFHPGILDCRNNAVTNFIRLRRMEVFHHGIGESVDINDGLTAHTTTVRLHTERTRSLFDIGRAIVRIEFRQKGIDALG